MENLLLKKILAIVEGEKADCKLMNHLLNLFFKGEFYVWPYCTNLYSLYNTFRLNDLEDFDSLDTILAIKSQEKDKAKLAKLSEKYTDIILIFDLDPQDPIYSSDKILKMKEIFNESTDNGRLYINYPMVEAFKHLKAEIDNNFIDRKVQLHDLIRKQYKAIVNRESYQCDYEMYNEKMSLKVMKQNLQKSCYIINNKYEIPLNINDYETLDFTEILAIQTNMLATKGEFYVLCTCIIYLLDDYKPAYFLNILHNI